MKPLSIPLCQLPLQDLWSKLLHRIKGGRDLLTTEVDAHPLWNHSSPLPSVRMSWNHSSVIKPLFEHSLPIQTTPFPQAGGHSTFRRRDTSCPVLKGVGGIFSSRPPHPLFQILKVR
ncbi:hypothetical protein CEXT_628891 [Caerostris extrusa]|uniref:Uncharacterized protein n=1 Tax=Caerostris extrusa TaxID=172846 RepID=A0AAV4NDS9_CAEEX|nr:hypothetical protein CEXT_628891 [Caerostris extrusa]